MRFSLSIIALAVLVGQGLAAAMPALSSSSSSSSISNSNSTLSAPKQPPKFSVTIYNSDCPCDRTLNKFCTFFQRKNVTNNVCYKISRPSQSMRVFHPLIATNNRLQCQGFMGENCDGMATPEALFADNTMCVYLTKQMMKTDRYRSFSCKHTGW